MKLRQQIREKDAMIDNLLSQVNPGPTMATPLTLVPARLPLSQKERGEYRDVLTYLERAAQQAGTRFMGDGRAKFDISALEDVVSEDDEDEDDDMAGTGGAGEGAGARESASPKREHQQHQHQHAQRGASPKVMDVVAAAQNVDAQPIWEAGAPTGFLAQAALQNSYKGANDSSASDATSSQGGATAGEQGVAGDRYFLPGKPPLLLPSPRGGAGCRCGRAC